VFKTNLETVNWAVTFDPECVELPAAPLIVIDPIVTPLDVASKQLSKTLVEMQKPTVATIVVLFELIVPFTGVEVLMLEDVFACVVALGLGVHCA
jgi:hypothetical protein